MDLKAFCIFFDYLLTAMSAKLSSLSKNICVFSNGNLWMISWIFPHKHYTLWWALHSKLYGKFTYEWKAINYVWKLYKDSNWKNILKKKLKKGVRCNNSCCNILTPIISFDLFINLEYPTQFFSQLIFLAATDPSYFYTIQSSSKEYYCPYAHCVCYTQKKRIW